MKKWGVARCQPILTGETISFIVQSMEMKPAVLVVDDEPGVRQSLEVILEDDYQVVSVGSGQEALQTLQRLPVDLILLDVNMPDMDGLEVLRKIREQDEEADVIMVSALNLLEKLWMPSNWELMTISPSLTSLKISFPQWLGS